MKKITVILIYNPFTPFYHYTKYQSLIDFHFKQYGVMDIATEENIFCLERLKITKNHLLKNLNNNPAVIDIFTCEGK